MPARRHAHLLLPSALGLLEYDILEDQAFIGPGKRGGLQAAPDPFPKAVLALTRQGDGFIAKPLPGETAPEIDGEGAEGGLLGDGDRIKLGDQVALFRTDRVSTAAPKAEAPRSPAASRPRSAPRGRARPERRRSHVGTALGLVGALLLLIGAMRALDYVQAMRDAKESAAWEPPDAPTLPAGDERRASREFLAMVAFEQSHPDKPSAIVDRWQAFIKRYPREPEVDAAQDRIRELVDTWGRQERLRLEDVVQQSIEKLRFGRALRAIRIFEERFGATTASLGVGELRRQVREAAETEWKQLEEAVRPVMKSNPSLAHNMLVRRGVVFPPDLQVEFDLLFAEIGKLLEEEAAARLPGPGRRTTPREGPTPPPEPARPGPAPLLPPPGEPLAEDVDGQAREMWRDAQTHLRKGEFSEAADLYERVLKRFAQAPLVVEHEQMLRAGHFAARVGRDGPPALLSVPSIYDRGVLEVVYDFQTWAELDDFDTGRPFSSDRDPGAEFKNGSIHLTGCTGLILEMVFTHDVELQAKVIAHGAHDFGVIAVEEADDFRAVFLNVNNTRFGLKKGPAARAHPGHMLWYVGKGVWADADEDAHGYIHLDQRRDVKIQDGDRGTLELERRSGNRIAAGYGGASDGVQLKGEVKGDDGSTMGSARVGVFTDTGIIEVQQLRIRGTIDPTWWARRLEMLIAADPGPE